MEWLLKILENPVSIAHITLLYALTISLGVRLGRIKFGGVALGVTFVLFVGIVLGHVFTQCGMYDSFVDKTTGAHGWEAAVAAQKEVLDYVKELGLILFVYCIGLQVGPSFFATFKQGGLPMNLIAVGIVVLNVLVMVGLLFLGHYTHLLTGDWNHNLSMMVGVMYGAVTNTPGLGAANGILPDLFGGADVPAIASGYACAYPLGVVGIILSTILLRFICGVSLQKEQEKLTAESESNPHVIPCHMAIRVTNAAVVDRSLQQLHDFLNRQFVVTRLFHEDGTIEIANSTSVLKLGMEIHLTCSAAEAETIAALMGEQIPDGEWKDSETDMNYVSQRLIITKPEINGKTFGQLHFSTVYGCNVTRVTRGDMDLFANRNLRLMVGDRMTVTGTQENIDALSRAVGSSVKALRHPNVGAIFFGILLGVLVGQIPINLGMPVPVKLGLAGGPLVVAILIGAFGYKYKINTYVSTSANLMLREVGLILFLASVGIQAGATFWQTVMNGGYHYVWMGFLITTVPILIMGVIARWRLKINYFTLMGLIAGSNTDPPALAFASQTAGNDAPAMGYSTVYPLSMFLRILMAQLVLVILFGLL